MPDYTYDHSQVSVDDQVKFHIRQTGTGIDATAAGRDISDQEIAAVVGRVALNGRAIPYMAAAECIDSIIAGHASSGSGIESKQISKLKVVYGGRSTKLESLLVLRDKLREKAAFYSRGKPRAMRFVNSTGYSGYWVIGVTIGLSR